MGRKKCIICDSTSNFDNEKNCRIHYYSAGPVGSSQRQRTLCAAGRLVPGLKVNSNLSDLFVCNKHYSTNDQYKPLSGNRVLLKSGSIPVYGIFGRVDRVPKRRIPQSPQNTPPAKKRKVLGEIQLPSPLPKDDSKPSDSKTEKNDDFQPPATPSKNLSTSAHNCSSKDVSSDIAGSGIVSLISEEHSYSLPSSSLNESPEKSKRHTMITSTPNVKRTQPKSINESSLFSSLFNDSQDGELARSIESLSDKELNQVASKLPESRAAFIEKITATTVEPKGSPKKTALIRYSQVLENCIKSWLESEEEENLFLKNLVVEYENLKLLLSTYDSADSKRFSVDLSNAKKKYLYYKSQNEALKKKLKEMQQSKLLSVQATELLSDRIPKPAMCVLRRLFVSLENDSMNDEYEIDLKIFSATLHYISPKAFDFLRDSLNKKCLPHPRTVRRWFQQVEAEPGFTVESFALLTMKVMKFKAMGRSISLALSMDDMSLREHVELCNGKTFGYVNMGHGIESNAEKANHACVLYVVSLDPQFEFKMPVGYFLIKSLSGSQRAEILSECIDKLLETGAKVYSVTCDGHSSNFSMLKALGADIKLIKNDLASAHTQLSSKDATRPKIHALLDPSHMIKLVRNAWADLRTILSPDGHLIKWKYIEELVKLQSASGFKAANKLGPAHINWRSHKMKVKVAVQTLSKSVADAIQFCLEEGYPQFEGAEATIEFLRNCNNCFDMLNSSSTRAYGFKAPVTSSNIIDVKTKFGVFSSYFAELKNLSGVLLIDSPKFTGFLGLLSAMQSIPNILEELQNHSPDVSYLCTRRLSQDYLEAFFGTIRQKGGFNNNPSCKFFMSAYKKILVAGELKASECSNVDFKGDITFLKCARDVKKKPVMQTLNVGCELTPVQDYEEEILIALHSEHDYISEDLIEELINENN